MNRIQFILIGSLMFVGAFFAGFFLQKSQLVPKNESLEFNKAHLKSQKTTEWSLFQPIEANWHPLKKEWLLKESWPQPKGWRYIHEVKHPLAFQLEGVLDYGSNRFLCVTIGDTTHLKRFETESPWDNDWVMESFACPSLHSTSDAPILILRSNDHQTKLHIPLGSTAFEPSGESLWEHISGERKIIPIGQSFRDDSGTLWTILNFCDDGIQVKPEGADLTVCYKDTVSLSSIL